MTPERFKELQALLIVLQATEMPSALTLRECLDEITRLQSAKPEVALAAQHGFLEGVHLAALYFQTAQNIIDFNAGYTKRHQTPAEIERYADAMKATIAKDWEKHKERILAALKAITADKGETT